MRVEWTAKAFEECLDRVSYPNNVQRKEFQTEGKFPVISQESDFINGYWDDEADVLRVERPVIVFGDHTQVLKYVDFDFVLGADGVKILKPKSFIDPRFFYYFLMAHPIEGVGYARHYRYLKELTVRYPALPEQQRIVAILDEAFAELAAASANAEKNLKNARELFESYLDSLFSSPQSAWTVCPLAECVEFVTYGFTNPMPTTEVGPWMVTAKNVVGGKIDYASARHTSREAFESLLTDKSRPNIGDVLLTKDGTLGRLAVVDRDRICINQSVALLRPNGRMIAHLMKYLLSSREYQRRMIGEADGATIKHIYITRVPKMDVAFPPSLSAQRELVAKLDALSDEARALEGAYLRKLDSLRSLKQSILQKAFSGELTSPPSQAIKEAAE